MWAVLRRALGIDDADGVLLLLKSVCSFGLARTGAQKQSHTTELRRDIARDMYAEGVFVIGFFHPVVGKGLARIRCQMSAAHDFSHIDKAIEAFTKVGRKYDILGKTKEQIIAQYGE